MSVVVVAPGDVKVAAAVTDPDEVPLPLGFVITKDSLRGPADVELTVTWKLAPAEQPPEQVIVTQLLPPQVVGVPQLRPPVAPPQVVMVAPLGLVSVSTIVPALGRSDVVVTVQTVDE